MKMNPNEVNIEFVNKQNDYIPYEIYNPHYFYPTDNLKNNDFYISINTLDFSAIKYNFIDFYNLANYFYEIKASNIKYGISYAFMLKVDKYFLTNRDNKEDCAMIIYIGEESQNTP